MIERRVHIICDNCREEWKESYPDTDCDYTAEDNAINDTSDAGWFVRDNLHFCPECWKEIADEWFKRQANPDTI
ncbi:MAG: hypothetical protein LUC85_06735 [Bacteroidales bacterium]|nr:hypothetical protein [Bacteroidales bacterium]MCD8394515.1 hypothetical protein [Bacteroidales bacterium]